MLSTDGMPVDQLDKYGQRLEALGYETVWVPEVGGREPFATSAHLLARTSRIRVGTAIANVYARDAVAAAQGRQTLGELSGGRFTLGLGVSHPFLVESRGHDWVMPVPKMRSYLKDIAATAVTSPTPRESAPILIAAHGPGLVRVACENADGIFMYLMPPERVREAARTLGPQKDVCVVMRCCLSDSADDARATARNDLGLYIGLPPYQRVWKAAGFEDADFEDGGSDALIDAMVAWGGEPEIRARIDTLADAGATQVVLLPSKPVPASAAVAEARVVDWACLEALAPG